MGTRLLSGFCFLCSFSSATGSSPCFSLQVERASLLSTFLVSVRWARLGSRSRLSTRRFSVTHSWTFSSTRSFPARPLGLAWAGAPYQRCSVLALISCFGLRHRGSLRVSTPPVFPRTSCLSSILGGCLLFVSSGCTFGCFSLGLPCKLVLLVAALIRPPCMESSACGSSLCSWSS
jgi:hypothetical protein